MKIDKEKVDSISKSFCAAKWTQVTLHLGNGYNHSCHHPRLHKISEEEIKINPSALHNTKYKIERRKEMMEGKRPVECDYCWKVEDSNKNNISDRYFKSNEDWSYEYIDDIVKNPYDENFIPKYVEVSFSNQCNFKCSYCMPEISSQWLEEIKQYGPYPTSTHYGLLNDRTKDLIPNNKFNPYIDAWWRWYPSLVKNLLYLRVTGGEPFLNKNTFLLLEKILENPQPHLTLSLNSNLCVPEKNIKKIIDLLKEIQKNKCVKKLEIYTSCEAYGDKANYIRWGLDYDIWKKNIFFFNEEIYPCKIIIMSTFNLLSITSYDMFLVDVLKMKKEFKNESHLILDTPYLRWPVHQTAWLYDEKYAKNYIDNIYDLFKKNVDSYDKKKFFEYEYLKFKRVIDIIFNEWKSKDYFIKYKKYKNDFVKFVDEHDRRRGSNFLEIFPEMCDFYYENKY